jgi:hypothetical protein
MGDRIGSGSLGPTGNQVFPMILDVASVSQRGIVCASSSPMLPRRVLRIPLPLLLTTACLAATVVACGAAPEDDEVGSDEGQLVDPATPRGRATAQYPVAGRPNEICVAPQHLAGADYDKDDAEDEDELCTYNFHGSSPGKSVATCPKVVSTNPGVDVHELLPGKTKAESEAAMCARDEGRTKLLAKYKQSITCSYAPSILGYYHLSRALGGVGSVKPAVMRTMDLEAHKKITAVGVANTTDLINTLWRQWASWESNPSNPRYTDALFTSDLKQIYGAMQVNPRGEAKYVDPISGKSINVRGATDFSSPFRATPAYKAVLDGRPVSQWVPKTLEGGAQRIVQMKDISDMVLIDTLMAQQDRFGNIHSMDYYYSVEGTELRKVRKSKVDDGDKPMPAGGVLVREMLLKDNDCGVVKTNVAKQAGMLRELKHMSAKTYAHLRWFNAQFGRGSEAAKFFVREVLMTQKDIDMLRTNLADADATLTAACKAGSLKLDVDLADHLAGKNDHDAAICDASEPPEQP